MQNSPATAIAMPPARAIKTEVFTALRIVFSSPLPTACAITILAPSAIPIKKLSMSPMTGLFAPTAATATVLSDPVKFPTMARSEALKSCPKIPVAATGSA